MILNSAKNNLSSDLATVDGLDDLFVSGEESVMTVTGDAINLADITAEAVESWTLQDASDNLRVSSRTILRWLKKGKLDGKKIQGLNGPEWRITPNKENLLSDNVTRTSVMSDTRDTPTTADKTVDNPLVRDLLNKIEALTYRNGYLEAQLENERLQVKLLTDKVSSSKKNWWSRLCLWLAGQPTQEN